MTTTLDIMAVARRRIDELYVQAETLVDQYRGDTVGEKNGLDEYSSTPMLFPKITKTKWAFVIDWYYVHEWIVDSDDKWIAHPRKVTRKKGCRMKFRHYAEDDLLEIANDYEREAETIRREVAILVALQKHNRRIQKLRKAS